MKKLMAAALLLAATGCHHRTRVHNTVDPENALALTAPPGQIDSIWRLALREVRLGRWSKVSTKLERVTLEFPPGDPRIVQARFYLGEAQFALGDQLAAAREFRRVSDETPNDPLAPIALLRAGDAYADLWRKPELDPTYAQTAISTYQELSNRYPGSDAATRAREQVDYLQGRFAYKQYRAALYYYRLKAYDSAILYLKDVVATYPRSEIAPEALITLISAYQKLGYVEDVKETCGYLRRFHPSAPRIDEACPLEGAGPS
ncbi:MAG: outer membrane protein assembly factor BamD [Gemmatimonadota bacterium]